MRRQAAARNGQGDAIPADLVPYIPAGIGRAISDILEGEGQMDGTAENRIMKELATNHRENLALTAANHKENQAAIRGIEGSIATHNTRLVVVELDVKELKDAETTAAGERRNTARMIKGAIITFAVITIGGALLTYYGLRAVPPVAEAVKQDAAISTKMDRLIQIMQEREDREAAREAAPEPTVAPKPKLHATKPPKGQSLLREGEMITTKTFRLPELGYNRIPLGIPQ